MKATLSDLPGIVADLETPVSAFLKINRGGESSCWKASKADRYSRYSFIGTEPYRL
jgi:anthranilate synthase component 1